MELLKIIHLDAVSRECHRYIQISFVNKYLAKKNCRTDELLEEIHADFKEIIVSGEYITPARFYGMCLHIKYNF